ncbi:MAG: hypothetical protein K2X31_03035 [Sphingopyxis sp.]|nr:hypothetical protein [Sphingopyxis sp.]
MKLIRYTLCALAGHQPNRRRVKKHAEGDYRAACLMCGTTLQRRGEGDWRPR